MYAMALSKVFAYRCIEGRKLVEAAGGPEEPFRMGVDRLSQLLGGKREMAEEILSPATLRWAESELQWCEEYGIRALYIDEKDYPRRLRECCDAPLILYCKGGLNLNPERALAVVGTRKATWSGRTACTRTVTDLAALNPAPVIVSGLAFGIDATAHKAALEAGIPTIAVIPCGLDAIYPTAHRELAVRIVRDGAIVTDFPRRTSPQVTQFVRRNRIIAGMSDATLLAESYIKGGGLITTSLANAYDREVFAFPGRVTDASFAGCNAQIAANQAHLVTGAEEIGSIMGWSEPASGRRKKDPELPFPEDGETGRILALLKEESPLDFEQILERTGIPFRTLSALMVNLEINGTVVSLQGRKYALSH